MNMVVHAMPMVFPCLHVQTDFDIQSLKKQGTKQKSGPRMIKETRLQLHQGVSAGLNSRITSTIGLWLGSAEAFRGHCCREL
jgi:hypothetical protein